MQDFGGVPSGAGVGDGVAAIWAFGGEAHGGQAFEAGPVLEAVGAPVIGCENQAVQGRAATGLEVGLVPHRRETTGRAGVVEAVGQEISGRSCGRPRQTVSRGRTRCRTSSRGVFRGAC